MSIPFIDKLVDERFLTHRQRSTSTAGMIGAALVGVLFLYRMYFEHITDWYLFAILLLVVLTKFALMAYYFLTD